MSINTKIRGAFDLQSKRKESSSCEGNKKRVLNSFSQEFLAGMKKKVKEPEGMKMLKEAFKVFDDTGKGSLTRLKKISQ